MSQFIKYIFSFSIFALLGFSREFLFVNINNLLYKIYYQNNSIVIPNCLSFLSKYDYSTLYYIKYPLTIFYFILYFLISFYSVKFICLNEKITKWIVYIYGLILLLASITMLFNFLVYNQFSGEEYTFSRWLMGISQSPLIAFFTIATYNLYKTSQIKKN